MSFSVLPMLRNMERTDQNSATKPIPAMRPPLVLASIVLEKEITWPMTSGRQMYPMRHLGRARLGQPFQAEPPRYAESHRQDGHDGKVGSSM